MQFTRPDMREITISDKSEACDFIKDSCKECNRKYECTGENAAFCNHMKNIPPDHLYMAVIREQPGFYSLLKSPGEFSPDDPSGLLFLSSHPLHFLQG